MFEPGAQKKVTSYWPIIVTALAITVSAASANTRLNNLDDRVQEIWDKGPPALSERLARIDERQTEANKTLERVENKIDELESRMDSRYRASPQATRKLERL